MPVNTSLEAWKANPSLGYKAPDNPWGVIKTEPLAAPAAPPVAGSLPSGGSGPPVMAPGGGAAPAADPWKPVATTPVVTPPESPGGGWAVKAMEPLTTYFPTQRRMAQEGMRQVGEGVSEMGEGHPFKGALKAAGGAAHYLTSPIEAGLHTVVGKPLEENVGIPHEYSEFAAGLAIPGYGLTRTSSGKAAIDAARNAGKVLEKIVSPETVDADARAAAASIREMSGKAARDTAVTEAALEPAWKKVNAMPVQDRLDFVSYVEGRSGQFAGTQMRDPALQDLADTMRTAFEQRMNKIQAMPSHAQAAFIDDYYPHFWKDPGKAQQAAQSGGGMSRQGSGASLKKRTVPTIADGIAMGLEPVTTNPLEATIRYVTSMDRFIASTDVLDTAKNAGTIRFIKPRVMGASGHPSSYKTPPGWMRLEGRGSTDATGGQAYAPEGFARVYNNWISRGMHASDVGGQVYDAVRMTSNAITGLELGLSGYHFLTVSKAALDNSMANAISLLRSGKPIEAVKQAIKTPAAPFRYAHSGKQVKDVYLGLSQGSRELQNTVEKIEKAGGRAAGKAGSPDYEFSQGGSYYTAFKRGALKIQMTAARGEARSANIRAFGEARFAARQIGRIMDTIAAPLFEQYIPAVKNGAFRENLATWMMKNPNATEAEQINAARQIWDSVDDRFGEMVQDNIFMNKVIKQIGMLSLRSWSWTVGQDIRMLGGAGRDVVKAPFKAVTGTGPNDTRWTQKMDMVVAMPIVYGTLAALYQGWKTGEAPKDLHDLAAPRTGGTDASTGEPERLLLPGPEKDVAGVAMHGLHEVDGKTSKMISELWHLWNNKDWRGDPLFSGAEDAPPWLQQYWEYVGNNALPISMQGLAKGRKSGSNLGALENIMGVRTAPSYLTDKDAYDDMMKGIERGDYKKKMRHDEKQRGLYEE